MLFDAVERVFTVVNANFQADVNILTGLKGVTALTLAANSITKRQTAELMLRNGAALPGIGIYAIRAQTNMADGGLGGKRDSLCTVAADLVIKGTDPVLVQEQLELGAEVLVKEMCDRTPGGGSLTFGAGVERLSVSVTISDGYSEDDAPNYLGVATVTVPVWDREQTT